MQLIKYPRLLSTKTIGCISLTQTEIHGYMLGTGRANSSDKEQEYFIQGCYPSI